MDSNQPLVTIYIPTYNRVELLKRAVDSVLNQTYENIEIIVVDDCSTDETIGYLENLTQKESRVRYFQNETNSGACVSRNKAIKEAKGEFITGLDDDDYFLPNRIEDFVDYWEKYVKKNSVIVCLFCHYYVKKSTIGNNKMRIAKKPNKVKKSDLLIANYVGNQIFTYTKVLKNNLFDEYLPMWQDLDCWYRILDDDKIAVNIKKPSYVMDVSHPHERITKNKKNKVYRTFEYFKDKYKLDTKQAAMLYTHIFGYKSNNLTLQMVCKLFLKHKNLKALKRLIRSFVGRKILKIK